MMRDLIFGRERGDHDRAAILALSAGDDLDALVAEEVMDWSGLTPWTAGEDKDSDWVGYPPGAEHPEEMVAAPKYSADITAATPSCGLPSSSMSRTTPSVASRCVEFAGPPPVTK